MTDEEIVYTRRCIAIDIHMFYIWRRWKKERAEALKLDKYECQDCKAKGVYTKATTVHHINPVKRHPELALEQYYYDSNGVRKRNLISLCHGCHEIREGRKKKEPLTPERW